MYRTPLLDDSDKRQFYEKLQQEMLDLVEYEEEWLAALANTAALLGHQLRKINWVGFYLMKDGLLVLGPFVGKPACSAIALGSGVCGKVAESGEMLVVPDVHAFPDHIACDEASRSEIVIPLISEGRVVGVLDIDSPVEDRFSESDSEGLRSMMELLARHIRWSRVLF